MLGYFKVFICLITVCCKFLIVLFYSLLAAYCFSYDNFVMVVPDYGFASLAVVGVFDMFLIAARAFSSYTYRARISSALSILCSSSCGYIVMVTDFVSAVCFSVYFYGYYLVISIDLLVGGMSFVGSGSLGWVVPVACLDRSIILFSVFFGGCWWYW
jgi:hypothetical protein